MKLKLQFIFASILLVSTCALFSSCHHEDWVADDNELTDARHGGLTNRHVVATGEVQNVTHNSATILFSANYNYKELLGIKPGIIYSEYSYNGALEPYDQYASCVDINDFTSSACQVTLTNLKPNTTYYYRAYGKECGKNGEYGGYGLRRHYGEKRSFKTSSGN